jgi:hypothetical protein
MFYHWGLCTGGGSSSTEGNQLFVINSADELEEQAPEPEVFAANLVGLTKNVGAEHLTLTTFHSCDRFKLICPTGVPNFLLRTLWACGMISREVWTLKGRSAASSGSA